ncbi:Gfo/Idh/MocA family oxidoreductase [Aquitalea magnusonii]|uniref:Myo-inositol 2-dehydrogenase/D-chiro-inositol 1-dehydrogenase n=1 Tax=Aquitalea magnusonii TaxID=332411 RepID=A0A318J9Q5_9NEIS|nr:Gfo/Idh/MocA family oxidoreductase [Aquitalea magnusonii]PXX44623.1 myo-inositol 2-dehydrogenase/D-chiro-inositol 1-dehydrogenase [Aquitalea magnusonii]
MSELNIGIVGLGRLGRRHALNLRDRIRGAKLVAACSPLDDELAWAAEQLPGVHRHHTLDAMLAEPQVQAVFLVTPTALHAEQIIACLRAGKHVFCEKPLALNVEDCQKVEAVAAEYPQLKAMVGFVRRFDASYQDAAEKLQQGLVGQAYLLRSQTCDLNDENGFFVKFAPSSGGIFMDCSIHDIDLARWLLGSPKPLRVWATGTNALHPALADCGDVDNGVAMLEFADGKLACFYASRTQAHGHETLTEIFATAGRLTVGANPRANRVDISDAHGVRNECVQDFYQRFAEAFVSEAQHFVDAVLHDQALALSLADATEATRIGLAITQALRSKQVVEL